MARTLPKTKHATTNFKMLIPFIEEADRHEGYLKCESDGYMDLVIENLYYNDDLGNPVYSISHYGEQNGDLMADPDMTVAVNKEDKIILPRSFRNDYMGVEQEVFIIREGKSLYSPSLFRQLDDFLWHWLQNIEEQGFKPEQA